MRVEIALGESSKFKCQLNERVRKDSVLQDEDGICDFVVVQVRHQLIGSKFGLVGTWPTGNSLVIVEMGEGDEGFQRNDRISKCVI